MLTTARFLRRATSVLGASVRAACAAAILAPGATLAQSNYPDKPIKMIVPFVPGGSNDNISRPLGQAMSVRLKVPVVIENRGGAGGTIGTDAVAKAAPDGYTLLFISASISTNNAAGKKLPYDTYRDLEPIARIGSTALVILVNPKVPVRNFREYVEYSRTHANKFNYGTAGVGGYQHLATELLHQAAGVKATHIPYKGVGPAFADLISGELQMILASLPSATQHIQAGTFRAIAVTTKNRSTLAPDIPGMEEAGLKDFNLDGWWSVFGPGGLPKPIATRLYDTIAAIMATPEFKNQLEREGATPVLGTPDELAALVRSETARWQKVIKESNIKVE